MGGLEKTVRTGQAPPDTSSAQSSSLQQLVPQGLLRWRLTPIKTVLFGESILLNPYALLTSIISCSKKFRHLFTSCVKNCFPVFALNFPIL